MTELHTNEGLLKALRTGSSCKLSYEQLEKQRLSFVWGTLPENHEMTREEVQHVIERQKGRSVTKNDPVRAD